MGDPRRGLAAIPRKARRPVPEAPPTTRTFEIFGRELVVSGSAGRRWSVAVDGVPCPGSFETAAEAWAAGVGEIERLDGHGPN